MGLQEQHIAFKFAGGIETKMDAKSVPGVRLLGLQNGVFARAGSIKKRNGYSAVSRKKQDIVIGLNVHILWNEGG